MVSNAKKASNARWDAENMAYQTVKVKKQLLQDFKTACSERGEKVNAVLRGAMEHYITCMTAPAPEAPQYLTPEAMEQATQAAQAAGEELEAWITRAINDTAQRDSMIRQLKR